MRACVQLAVDVSQQLPSPPPVDDSASLQLHMQSSMLSAVALSASHVAAAAVAVVGEGGSVEGDAMEEGGEGQPPPPQPAEEESMDTGGEGVVQVADADDAAVAEAAVEPPAGVGEESAEIHVSTADPDVATDVAVDSAAAHHVEAEDEMPPDVEEIDERGGLGAADEADVQDGASAAVEGGGEAGDPHTAVAGVATEVDAAEEGEADESAAVASEGAADEGVEGVASEGGAAAEGADAVGVADVEEVEVDEEQEELAVGERHSLPLQCEAPPPNADRSELDGAGGGGMDGQGAVVEDGVDAVDAEEGGADAEMMSASDSAEGEMGVDEAAGEGGEDEIGDGMEEEEEGTR